MRLVLARHGATPHNETGLLTGQIDAPLTELGERQAEALAHRLATWRFDAIIASDLTRARRTAEAVARYHEQPVEIEPRLREIDMGSCAGKPFADWSEAERLQFHTMQSDPAGHVPAPGGESFAAVAERIEQALNHARERYPGGTVLWVTHGGVISALLCRALDLGFDHRQQFSRANCALFELTYHDDRTVIVRLNDTGHLEALATQS